ncbi:hypothetical protein BDV93DRAFT_527313 [Ceratobasidium sp. AG-I]|nr:hypothetical protein BDV93DRAFT_527313 [Ceratobasidium sp. AG-I]
MDSPVSFNARAPEDYCTTPDPHASRRPDHTDTRSTCNCRNQTTFLAAANNLTTAAQALAAAASALAAAGDSFRLLGGGQFGLDIFSNGGGGYINPPPQPIRKSRDNSNSWQQNSYVLPSVERSEGGLTGEEATGDVLLPAYPAKSGKRQAEDSANADATEPKKRRKKIKIADDAVELGEGDAETGPEALAESIKPPPSAIAATDVGTKDPALKKKKKKAKADSEAQTVDGEGLSKNGSTRVTKEKPTRQHITRSPVKSTEPHVLGSDVSESSTSGRVETKVIQLKSQVDARAAPVAWIGRKTSGKRVTWAYPSLSNPEVNSDAESRSGPDSPQEDSVPDSEPE